MGEALVHSVERRVAHATVSVHEGGQGELPLLLIHGGWGGATHWSRVWNALAQHQRIIAPDLPGLGSMDAPTLPSVAAYASWLIGLLDTLSVERAICVGNSFGGSVAWSLAGRFPERCAGLVLVDGIPMPRSPTLLRRLGHTGPGATLMRWGVRRFSYNPALLQSAFVDPSAVPEDMRAMLHDPTHALADRFAPILVEGDGAPMPKLTPLLLWGAEDKLMGTRLSDARKLHAKLAGSTLRAIPKAGHFPQLEAPDRFVEELARYADEVRRAQSTDTSLTSTAGTHAR